jgi:hypothetical protein
VRLGLAVTVALLSGGLGLLAADRTSASKPAISLICDGVHEVQDVAVTAVVTGNGGVGTAITDGEVIRKARRIQIYIAGGSAQAHPEPAMLPRLVAKSNNGWFPVYDLVLGKDEISGRYRLNSMNKPRFRIDRRTGVIEETGASYFHGVCRKASAPPPQAQF